MKLLILIIFFVCGGYLSSGQVISAFDRQKSLTLLDESIATLKHTTQGLSEAQLNFKPAEGRWSIKNNVDHLASTEALVLDIILNTLKKPGDWQKSDLTDEEFIRQMSTREINYQAPDILQPVDDRYPNFDAAFHALIENRQKMVEFVKYTNEDLRAHFTRHPSFGNLDAYQWTLHVSAHCYRHVEQIREILEHKLFPDN